MSEQECLALIFGMIVGALVFAVRFFAGACRGMWDDEKSSGPDQAGGPQAPRGE